MCTMHDENENKKASSAQPQPSQRPYLRNSSSTQSVRLPRPSLSVSFSLPLSVRPENEDPPKVRVPDVKKCLGGELDEPGPLRRSPRRGRERRYHPPVYVSAIN